MTKKTILYATLVFILTLNTMALASIQQKIILNVASDFISEMLVKIYELAIDSVTGTINVEKFKNIVLKNENKISENPNLEKILIRIEKKITNDTSLEDYIKITEKEIKKLENQNIKNNRKNKSRLRNTDKRVKKNTKTITINKESIKGNYDSIRNMAKRLKYIESILAKETIQIDTIISKNICKENDNIHKAAARGEFIYVAKCLELGVNPNIKERNGWTPIHSAARHGHIGIIRLLVNNGANINIPDITRRTPLDQAIISRNIILIEYLKSLGATIR